MAIESKMVRGPIGVRSTDVQQKPGWGWGVGVILIVAAVGAGWYYLMGPGASEQGTRLRQGFGGQAGNREQEVVIASGDYQAVFLDNGQVYFGRLDTSEAEFYTLTDVFYLQSGAAGIDQTANLSLTKLGNEAHGPEDKMQINVGHVLFIEDMKNDSKVVQAIQAYKTSKQNP